MLALDVVATEVREAADRGWPPRGQWGRCRLKRPSSSRIVAHAAKLANSDVARAGEVVRPTLAAAPESPL